MHVIRDEYKFSEVYTPPRLPHREKEVELLVNTMKSSYGLNEGLYLIKGEPGIGKTSVARLSSKKLGELVKDFKVIHVNCRIYRTPTSVIQRILSSIHPGIPNRGLSLQEMMSILEDALKNEKNLLIVLDELDYLKEGEDLVYSLLRSHEGALGNPLTLLLIARWEPPYLMEPSIRSFMNMRIPLQKYSREQLASIVKYRAEDALYEGTFDEEIIDMIAEFSEHSGNARIAIRMLYLAAKFAEARKMSKITPELVREAASSVGVVGIDNEMLSALDVHDKVILLAVSRALSSSSKAWVKMGDLVEEYTLACEELGIQPYKYTAIWKRVRELRKIGLLETKKSKEGIRGQTTLVSLGSIPAEKMAKRIEEILAEELSPLPQKLR